MLTGKNLFPLSTLLLALSPIYPASTPLVPTPPTQLSNQYAVSLTAVSLSGSTPEFAAFQYTAGLGHPVGFVFSTAGGPWSAPILPDLSNSTVLGIYGANPGFMSLISQTTGTSPNIITNCYSSLISNQTFGPFQPIFSKESKSIFSSSIAGEAGNFACIAVINSLVTPVNSFSEIITYRYSSVTSEWTPIPSLNIYTTFRTLSSLCRVEGGYMLAIPTTFTPQGGTLTSICLTAFLDDNNNYWLPLGPPIPEENGELVSLARGAGSSCLALWSNGVTGNATLYSSLSFDYGNNWSDPVIVATGTSSTLLPQLSSTDFGFVVAFVNNATPAQLFTTFSSDGTSWSNPQIQISTELSNPTSVPVLSVGLASGGNSCLFAWNQTTSSVSSSFTSFSGASPTPAAPNLPPTPISTGTVSSPASIGENSSGFMTAWLGSNGNVYASFLPQGGTSWRSAVQLSSSGTTTTTPSVVGTSSGFMVAWNDSGTIDASFSASQGKQWTPSIVGEGVIANGSVAISGNGSDFLAAWVDSSGDPVSSYSSNNGETWSSPPTEIDTGTNGTGPIALARTSTGFLVAWNANSGGTDIYSSFLSDGGSSWSSAYLLTSSLGTGPGANNISLASGTGSNGVATWSDGNGNAYSSFTADNGATWSSLPILIATGLASSSGVTVTRGPNEGFTATWTGNDNNIYSAFFVDNGSSWSGAVLVSAAAGASTDYTAQASNNGSNTVFTWVGTNGQIYSTFSAAVGKVVHPSSGFFKPALNTKGGGFLH